MPSIFLQVDIGAQRCHDRVQRRRVPVQRRVEIGVRAAEKRARAKLAQPLVKPVVANTGHQALAQDHMGVQELHRHDRLRLVEMEHLRHRSGVARLLTDQGVAFRKGPFQRRWPAFTDQPHIGQRLLDDHATLSADHFETSPDEIHWGQVGTLNHYRAKLREITDSAFSKGEHAE
jgi:hypothetical protein